MAPTWFQETRRSQGHSSSRNLATTQSGMSRCLCAHFTEHICNHDKWDANYPLSTLLSSTRIWATTQSGMKFCLCVLFDVATGNHHQSDANCAHLWHLLTQNCHRWLLEHDYVSRVGSDVTFTCQVENISNYKVTRICRRLSYSHGHHMVMNELEWRKS